MTYEYRLVTNMLGVSWDDGTVDSHAEALTKRGQEFLAVIAEEGWEPLSHNVLPVEDGAILSMLVRRPAPRIPGSPTP